MLTDERRNELKTYCRLDNLTNDEESLLDSLYDGAVQYMANAGVEPPADGTGANAQYKTCINYLVLDGWDSRELQTTATVENPAFRRMLNQLKAASCPVEA